VYKKHEDFLSESYLLEATSQLSHHVEELAHILEEHHMSETVNAKPKIKHEHHCKILREEVISDLKAGGISLSLDCLTRLRKYKLIHSLEPNPDGGHMIVLDLSEHMRVRQTNWGTKSQ
jgi:hypothetical protein